MFVSSFNTYVHTTNINKNGDFKKGDDKEKSESFSKSLSDLNIVKPYIDKNLPINYVSNYKSFHNHQKLQEQLTSQSEYKLKQLSTLNNAKVAYDENSKMFSLAKKPSISLSQTPTIDENLPPKEQKAKEKSLRHSMINTYISNDNYYRITAA
ncbi:hypothetical protein Suden_1560 [Sulfurimonas denitrificans DSM 1251]|uniref:Uncharacterized protein n=1 Tax=Sulfurimonas denitrificans (strain ATCC 33889 / DSM 1251) TaxID=326298 RepID=Q30Q94_SULDN|nr:hypothetical protein [Sulfurimonas denitrificans]ABB44837.1 hypothetical protein Suden_1560 [Sulfurimonas denitrificans DSM 1251]MDD3443267.1 hypothetical protein [Sulfurimonas denitrificans]